MTLSPGTWIVDPARSTVGFRVRHIGFAHASGRFGAFSGTLEIADADAGAGRASGVVRVASVETGDASRDEFLLSPDFFDAARFGEIAFTSTELRVSGDARLRVVGDLTIRGVTRSATFAASPPDAVDATSVVIAAAGEISRAGFGLTFAGPSNALVGDKVRIELALVAARR